MQIAPGFGEENLAPLAPLGTDPGPKKKPTLAPGFGSESALPAPSQQATQSGRLSRNYIAESDLENYMAGNQSGLELFGKTIAQAVPEAVLGTIEAVSYLGDLQQMIDKIKGDETEYTNWLADAMKKAKEEIAQESPLKVFQTAEAREGFAPGDATWWAAHSPQVIGSVLSLIIPAAGVAGLVGKGAQALKLSQGATNFAKGLAATVTSRYAESTMEASAVYERAYNDLLAKGVTPEVARMQAGEQASNVWNTNWLFAVQDFFQYSTLLKGFSTAAKGSLGKSIANTVTQMASEGAEEAGQFIVGEEAYQAAMDPKQDYFGEGFSNRLYNYVRDPEFKASVLLGAMGGGVFTAAGPLGRSAVKGGKNLTDMVTKTAKKIFDRGLEKEAANYAGDTGTSQTISDVQFTETLFQRLNEGKLANYKQELESLKTTDNIDNTVRQNLENYTQDVDFIADEQAKLKTSKVPVDLHNRILATKLEQRQLGRLDNQLTSEINDIKREIENNKEITPELLPVKDLQANAIAYSELAKSNPIFAEKAANAQAAFEQAKAPLAFIPDLDAALTTSRDADIFQKTFQLTSTREKMGQVKKELSNLTTPEGIAKMRQEEADKAVDAASTSVLNNPDATKEEILQAAANTKNAELKTALAQKHQALVNANKTVNQEEVKGIIEVQTPDENLIEPPPPTEFDEPVELTPDEMVPTEFEVPFAGGITPEQAQKWGGLSKEQIENILDRVDLEQKKTPPIPVSEQKGKDIEALEQRQRTTVPAWLKEINEDGTQTEYTNNITGEKSTADKIFAVDTETGQLLANTPKVKIGDKVTLRVENDFPWTLTPGFRPDKVDNYVINVYIEGNPRPIKQLPSADNPRLKGQKVIEDLRLAVIERGELTTTISGKNVGTIRTTSRLNSLEVLNFDFVRDGENWRFARTPHNPILGFIDFNGNPIVPNLGAMNGITDDVITDVNNTFSLERSNDLSKLKGKVVTFRTAPDGSKRLVGLEPRQITAAENEWLLNNLPKLITSGDFATLNSIVYVPQHPSGIYSTKGGTKKPDVLNLDRRRIHIVNVTKDLTDVLIPLKGKTGPVWISVDSRQLDKVLSAQPFSFRIIGPDGNKSQVITNHPKQGEIVDKFKELLSQQFKNINKESLNSEIRYTNPINPEETFNSYYEYLVKTDSVQTNLPGSKTLGMGDDSSYSFNQVALYLDPYPSDITGTLVEEGNDTVVTQITTPTLPTSSEIEDNFTYKENRYSVTSVFQKERFGIYDNEASYYRNEQEISKLEYLEAKEAAQKAANKTSNKPSTSNDEALDEFFGPDAKLKPAIEQGFKLMSQKELDWFKDNIGPEFLEVAKNVDRFISAKGVEAFGQYYNSLVTVAEYAPEGTAYHEALHFFADPSNGLVTKKQSELINSIGEEKLAEQFEQYKLSDGKIKPESPAVKGFFARLWQMVKSLLGFKNSIERLFKDIDNVNLSEAQKKAIQESAKTQLDPAEPRYKKLPGFRTIRQQTESIQAFTSEVIRITNELAREEELSLGEFLTNPKNLETVLGKVRSNFEEDFNRIKAQPKRTNVETARYLSYLAMGIGTPNPGEESYVGTYEDPTTLSGFPTDGFKTKVLKDLSRYGFSVRINDSTIYTNPNEEQAETIENMELKSEDEGERLYDIDHTLINPSESMSQRMKLFLACVPEPVLGQDGMPTGEVKKSVFGTTKFLDFRKVDGNLTLKLRDSINPITRLTNLAKNDPIAATVYNALMNEKNKGNTRLFNEFAAKYNRDGYYKKTVLYGKKKRKLAPDEIDPMDPGVKTVYESYVQTIDSDRASSDRTLHNRWREEGVRKKIVDTDGTVNIPKATNLYNRLETFKNKAYEANAKKARIPFDDVKNEFNSILSELGVVLPQQVWQEFNEIQNPGLKYKKLATMFFNERDRSLWQLLYDAKDGKDPFRGSTVLTNLAKTSSVYLDDSRGGAYRNDTGNLENPINWPSALTELVNNIKNNPREVFDFYSQDSFYTGNQFLQVIRNNPDKIDLSFTSVLRRNDDNAKAFEDRGEVESIIMRLTTFYNNGGNEGFFFTGTPADKTKQPIISLPKHKGVKAAKDFLFTVLKGTMKSEVVRIQRLNNFANANNLNEPLPKDIANYKNNNKFMYIPGLNSVPGLTSSLSAGEVSTEQYNKAVKKAEVIITNFIDTEFSAFKSFLAENDIIQIDEKGNITSERIPEGLLDNKGLAGLLEEFFYNDLAWRMEVSKVLMGDLAFYKNPDDYFKRAYQTVTPGIKAFSETSKTTVRAIYPKQMKLNTPEYLSSLVDLGASKETVDKYASVNKTDAQSLSDLETWKLFGEGLGLWSKDHERVYSIAWSKDLTIREATRQMVNAGYITEQEGTRLRSAAAKILLQPWKPFQFNNRLITLPDGSKMIIKEQFKDSITPITPELTSIHKGYSDLLKFMRANKIGIMSAEDTTKVGLYGMITDLTTPVADWQKRVVNLSDFRFPQLIPDKSKTDVKGTQFHKLILGNIDDSTMYKVGRTNMLGKTMKEKYNTLWQEKIDKSSKGLQKKLGIGSTFRLSDDPAKRRDQIFKLKTTLEQELLSRDLNENYQDVLDLVRAQGGNLEFTLPLSFPAFGQKFQSLLSNLWKKNVLSQDSPGYSAINLADFGVGYDDELKFITNENSEITEAEIGLPLSNLAQIGLKYGEHILPSGRIMWDKLNNNQQEQLQLILYRIPTSNKSSMIPVRVVKIVPPNLNNVVIIPGELTIQQGLDFDVDKSQLLKRVTDKEGKIDNEDVDTQLFNIYWSVLTNKAHIQELLTPLDTPTLAGKLQEYIDKGLIDLGVSSSVASAQSDVKAEVRNKDGKAEIGIASRFNTGHAVLQNIKDYVGVSAEIGISIPNYKFNELGRTLDASGKYISENHAEGQQAALDSAKNPILAYIGVVTGTMSTFHTMIDFGVPLPVITDFFMQPVVREWTKFYKQEGQNPKKATEKLFNTYPAIKKQVNEIRNGTAGLTLTPKELSEGIVSPITSNTLRDAAVITEFLNINDLAVQLGKINNVLSVDTFSDTTGIESMEAFLQQKNDVTNPEAQIYIDQRIFDPATTPPTGKRLAAFFQRGVEDAITYTSQFFPLASESYRRVVQEYADATGQASITDKNLIKQINQFTDYFNLEGDSLLSRTLVEIHPQKTTSSTNLEYQKAVSEANSRTSIPQNLTSGVTAFGTLQNATEQVKEKLGPSAKSIEMIEAGLRTRTTRSVGEVEKYNLNVGDYVWQESYGKKILTKVTDIYGQSDPRFKSNWYKEGWTEEGIKFLDRLKPGAKAIEFQVVTNQGSPTNQADYRNRWSFFAPEKSIAKYIDRVIDSFPNLKSNELIRNLETQRNENDKVQAIGIRNTDNNTNKSEITNGWYELLTHPNEVVRGLGHDLVRYAVFTTAFNFNQRSMFELVPVQFWIDSGFGRAWENIVKSAPALKIDREAAVVNFIRHNFKNIDRFPELYGKFQKGKGFFSEMIVNAKLEKGTNHIIEFTLSDSYLEDNLAPRFLRFNDNQLGDYRLYEANPSNPAQFKEVEPLGELNGYYEVSADGRNQSKHPANRKLNLSPNPWDRQPGISSSFPLFGNTQGEISPYIYQYLPEQKNSVQTVLEALLRDETDVEAKNNINALLKNVSKISAPIELQELDNKLGVYEVRTDGTSSIKINPKGNVTSENMMRHVILHEVNHAYSVGVLQNPSGEQQINFVRNIDRLAKEQSMDKFEFIAELASNKEFRTKLRGTGLWSRLLRTFRKLFGFKDTFDSILDQYYNILDNAQDLQAFTPNEFAMQMNPQEVKGSKRISLMQQMLASLEARKDRLVSKGRRTEAKALEGNIKVLEQLSKTKRNEAVVRYLLTVEEEMNKLKEAYNLMAKDPSKINPDALYAMREQLVSYKLLDAFSDQIHQSPENFVPEGGDSAALLKSLDELRADVHKMNNNTRRLAIQRFATVIKNNLTDPKITLESIIDQLEVADRDIDWINRWTDVAMEMDDIAIRTAHRMLTNNNLNAYTAIQDELYVNEPKKQSTEIVLKEQSGKKYIWKKRKVEFTSHGRLATLNNYEGWLKTQGINSNSIADKFAPVIDQNSLEQNADGVHLISPFSKEGIRILNIKEGSKDYPLRQFYETFVLGYFKSQEKIPAYSMRPGLRIPSIQRSLLEGVIKEEGAGKFSVIKERALDSIRRRYDETDFKAVDENGKPQEYLPVRYIAKQDGQGGRLSTREVSLDIASTLTLFAYEMHTRAGLENIQSDLELGKLVLAEREVMKTRRIKGPGLTPYLTREREGIPLASGKFDTIKGEESQSFKAYETLLRRFLYGQQKKEEGDIEKSGKKYSIAKMFDSLLRISGFKIMFGNLAIPLTNAVVGEISFMKEVVGGNLINLAEYKAGKKFFSQVAMPSAKDLGNREKKTKAGRILTYFNPLGEHRPVSDLGIDTNWMRTIWNTVSRTGNSTTEFYLGASAIGATFARFNAENSKGEKVSLYDALEVSNTGKIQLANGFTYKGKKSINSQDVNEVRDYTLRVYQLMNGVYNTIDKAAFNEYIAGRAVGFMRNWLVPGIQARWKTKHYDEKLKTENEGHYLSALVAFNNAFTKNGVAKGTLDTLRILTWFGASDPELLLLPNELNLSEEEKNNIINLRKSNIRKTLFELYLVIGLGALIGLAWDDDDESYTKYMLARIRREVSTFYSPSTAWDVLRSPTVALNLIDGFRKIQDDMFDSMGAVLTGEEQPMYESGPYKGEYKLPADLKRQFGLGFEKQFDDLDTKTRIIIRGGLK